MTNEPIEAAELRGERVHRALGEPSRRRILAVLREAGSPLDADEIAARVGLHPNTVRSHLRVLGGAELVSARQGESGRPGRPRVAYEAARVQPDERDLAAYRLLARVLTSYLASSGEDVAGRAEHAGRSWGGYLARPAPFVALSTAEALGRLTLMLDELGFEPELAGQGRERELVMRRCPFSELAESYRTVVCPLHLGLLEGALDELAPGVEVDELVPFARPDACVAQLSGCGC